MKKKIFIGGIYGLYLLATLLGHAQNPVWTLPEKYLSYNQLLSLPTQPPSGGYDGSPALFTSNMIKDENNFIRFFMVDERVYESNGLFVGGLYCNGHEVTGAQEVCIVPDPKDCNKYYIFSAYRNNEGSWYPTVSHYDALAAQLTNYTSGTAIDLVDAFSLQSSWGYATNYLNVKTRVGIASSGKRNDGSYWVFIHDGVRTIYRFKVSQAGVNYDGISAVLPPSATFPQFYDQLQRAELEIYENPNGTFKIAGTFTALFSNAQVAIQIPTVFYGELNTSGNLINSTYLTKSYEPMVTSSSPPFSFETGYIHGLEFSPNGSYLYVVHTYNPLAPDFNNPVEYFDLTNTGNFTPISIANSNDAKFFDLSQVELNIDGKLYLVNNQRIAILYNPNTPNVNNWNWNAITMIGNYSWNDELTGQNYLRTYILPDQIDRMDYISHLQNYSCCISRLPQNYYQVQSFSYSSNTIENAFLNSFGNNPVVRISNQIIIPAGVEVEMNNMELRFSPSAKLIIEQGYSNIPGGKLRLNNCLLTLDTVCNASNLWSGIEVRGLTSASQLPINQSAQGLLRLNNTIIEYAENGVLLSEKNVNGSFNMQRNGGIVIAINSIFKNNMCDVRVYPYQNYHPVTGVKKDNVSQFLNCKFITNDFKKHTYTPWHVSIRESNGITFKGCDFANEETNLTTNFFYWGSGIYTANASVKILPLCNNVVTCSAVDRCKFKNLQRGVYITNVNQVNSSVVDQCDFTDVYRAIYATGTYNTQITRNEIQLIEPAFNSAWQAYAVYLNQCKVYRVEENYIHGDLSGFSPQNTYGIIIHASGKNDHIVYKNSLVDLRVGVQSQGINSFNYFSSSPPLQISSGLQWKCNNFRSIYEADIAYPNGSIARNQGFCVPLMDINSPAGNIFSRSSYTTYNEFWLHSNVSPIFYRHHDINPPSPIGINPIYFSPWNITLEECINNYYDITKNVCNSKLPPNGGILYNDAAVFNQIKRLTFKLDTAKLVIDGGNTNQLLQNIQNNTNPSQLKNLLLEHAPMLSDTVLKAYLVKTGIPATHYQQVLTACSPLSQKVWQYVNSSGLPISIKAQLATLQNQYSPMENQIKYINYLISERNVLIDQLINSWWDDTLCINPLDSVISLIKNYERPDDDVLMSYLYLSAKDSIDFFEKLNEIDLEHGNNSYFKLWMELLWSIKHKTASYTAIKEDSNKQFILEQIAFNNEMIHPSISLHAKNLWSMAFDTLYNEIIEPLIYSQARIGYDENEGYNNFINFEGYLFPNPTKEDLYINLPALEEGEVYLIQLINLNGQIVREQPYQYGGLYHWQLDNIPAGIYLLQIRINGQLWLGQKVIKAGN